MQIPANGWHLASKSGDLHKVHILFKSTKNENYRWKRISPNQSGKVMIMHWDDRFSQIFLSLHIMTPLSCPTGIESWFLGRRHPVFTTHGDLLEWKGRIISSLKRRNYTDTIVHYQKSIIRVILKQCSLFFLGHIGRNLTGKAGWMTVTRAFGLFLFRKGFMIVYRKSCWNRHRITVLAYYQIIMVPARQHNYAWNSKHDPSLSIYNRWLSAFWR